MPALPCTPVVLKMRLKGSLRDVPSYDREKVWLRRPRKLVLPLPSLPTELVEPLRRSTGRSEVQFPAPPRPTW